MRINEIISQQTFRPLPLQGKDFWSLEEMEQNRAVVKLKKQEEKKKKLLYSSITFFP